MFAPLATGGLCSLMDIDQNTEEKKKSSHHFSNFIKSKTLGYKAPNVNFSCTYKASKELITQGLYHNLRKAVSSNLPPID